MRKTQPNRRIFAAFGVAAALTMSAATAQNGAKQPDDMLIPPRFQTFLTRFDTDKNGKLSSAEIAAMPPALRDRVEKLRGGSGGAAPGGVRRPTSSPTAAAVPLPNASDTPRVPDAGRLELARAYTEGAGGQTMVVYHDGKLLFESYTSGGSKTRRQMLASGSKSFVGVAAMAAVQDGLLRLDDRASDTLTEWKTDPQKAKITVRQMLQLSSGLKPDGRETGFADAIAAPLTGTPGAAFVYGPVHLEAFGDLLQRKLQGKSKADTFEAYLKRRVLDPLGITVQWNKSASGDPLLGGGAVMTARDWAVFGEWMRQGGRTASGKQIVDAKLLALCIQSAPTNPAYGLTWWLKKPVSPDLMRRIPILQHDMGSIVSSRWLGEDLYMAAGAGKQRLYVIPSLHLVAVRQGPIAMGNRYNDIEFLSRLLRGKPDTK